MQLNVCRESEVVLKRSDIPSGNVNKTHSQALERPETGRKETAKQ